MCYNCQSKGQETVVCIIIIGHLESQEMAACVIIIYIFNKSKNKEYGTLGISHIFKKSVPILDYFLSN